MENRLENAGRTYQFNKIIEKTTFNVYREHLNCLTHYDVLPVPQDLKVADIEDIVAFLRLEKLVSKEGENIFQKLSTIYAASTALGANLIILMVAAGRTQPIDFYVGLKTPFLDDKNRALSDSFKILKNSLDGNFTGSEYSIINDIASFHKHLTGMVSQCNHIATVSCVYGDREAGNENATFVQGIERLINSMSGSTYIGMIIAEPLGKAKLAEQRLGCEELYNALLPYSKVSWSYQASDSHSVAESITETTGNSLGKSISHTDSQSKTKSWNVGLGMNAGANRGLSNSTSNTVTNAVSANVGHGPVSAGVSRSVATAASIANTITHCMGASGNIGYSAANTTGTSDGKTYSEQETLSHGVTSGSTASVTNGTSIQINYSNKTLDDMIKRVEKQLERLDECDDYGAYTCAAYFLSPRTETAIMAAETYKGLLMGKGTSAEASAINLWSNNSDLCDKDDDNTEQIKQWLLHFEHPVFSTEDILTKEKAFYTAGNLITGRELPYNAGLPLSTIYGLSVIECSEFGKQIASMGMDASCSDKVRLGNVKNMFATTKVPAELDIESLSMHTLITGSTGSGKSNTVYGLINQLSDQHGIKYMIIEPAKGEYKHVLGNKEGVHVFGTNPKLGDILRINPFIFPDNIHVLEHVDRLVEIFNACWPMYAAMPAILKESLLTAYKECGWDMVISNNEYGIYPSFDDVLLCVENIVKKTQYSSDTQGDYIGALVTRIRSLTTGLNAMIFSSDEISNDILFDGNVIVDLSRLGALDTKSLIMGILVMRLNEYRMSSATGINSRLTHVTVLEEAHNLLKRTSQAQVQDSANIAGKSVEMLSNSIAEMRTYGEGFIIVDQSPGALDISAVRNTNTKIIMRLPEVQDRESVGKAVGLSDRQIVEISRLPMGTAIVYQNNWLEAVLCNVDKFDAEKSLYKGEPDMKVFLCESIKLQQYILYDLLRKYSKQKTIFGIDKYADMVMHLKAAGKVKYSAIRAYAAEKDISCTDMQQLIYYLMVREDMLEKAAAIDSQGENSLEAWRDFWLSENYELTSDMPETLQNLVVEGILREQISRGLENRKALEIWHKHF